MSPLAAAHLLALLVVGDVPRARAVRRRLLACAATPPTPTPATATAAASAATASGSAATGGSGGGGDSGGDSDSDLPAAAAAVAAVAARDWPTLYAVLGGGDGTPWRGAAERSLAASAAAATRRRVRDWLAAAHTTVSAETAASLLGVPRGELPATVAGWGWEAGEGDWLRPRPVPVGGPGGAAALSAMTTQLYSFDEP